MLPGAETIYLDAAVDPSAPDGQVSLCAQISASFQPGGGYDPNPSNNIDCKNTLIQTVTPTATP